ncbi:CoA transferase subunit A [Guggenheimella bovis]
MNKRISIEEAVSHIKAGDTLMVGGFLAAGSPLGIIDALVEKGTKDLTLICNDTSFVDKGVGKMVVAKQFKKIMASHIGTNKETGRQMTEGETEVQLIPQGTLAERIRCGGYGLGGVLTKTGVGTEIEKGKDVIEIEGQKYLLELPLRGNVAIISAKKADEKGNLYFHGATKNFGVLMAAAADIVIAEVEEIVPVGELDPDFVHVPGIFVTYLVEGGK